MYQLWSLTYYRPPHWRVCHTPTPDATQALLPALQLPSDLSTADIKTYVLPSKDKTETLADRWGRSNGCTEPFSPKRVSRALKHYDTHVVVPASASKTATATVNTSIDSTLKALELGAKARAIQSSTVFAEDWCSNIHDALHVVGQPAFEMAKVTRVCPGGGALATVDAIRTTGTHGKPPAIMVLRLATDKRMKELEDGDESALAEELARNTMAMSMAAHIHGVDDAFLVYYGKASVYTKAFQVLDITANLDLNAAASSLHYILFGRLCMRTWIAEQRGLEQSELEIEYTLPMVTHQSSGDNMKKRKVQYTTGLLESEQCNPGCKLSLAIASKTVMTVTNATLSGSVVGVYSWHYLFPSKASARGRWKCSHQFTVALLAAFERAGGGDHPWVHGGKRYCSTFEFKSPSAIVLECVHDHTGHHALETPLAKEKLAEVEWVKYASLHRDGLKVH